MLTIFNIALTHFSTIISPTSGSWHHSSDWSLKIKTSIINVCFKVIWCHFPEDGKRITPKRVWAAKTCMSCKKYCKKSCFCTLYCNIIIHHKLTKSYFLNQYFNFLNFYIFYMFRNRGFIIRKAVVYNLEYTVCSILLMHILLPTILLKMMREKVPHHNCIYRRLPVDEPSCSKDAEDINN
jgi:hypothetical protein